MKVVEQRGKQSNKPGDLEPIANGRQARHHSRPSIVTVAKSIKLLIPYRSYKSFLENCAVVAMVTRLSDVSRKQLFSVGNAICSKGFASCLR